jgi:NAD(P)-dependent dehydrogenase (short-subunit alcohol dehydrogenase family)
VTDGPRTGDLEGRVAVVTGGASGIGAAVVERLQARGAEVVVADRNSVPGHPAVDVTDPASVEGLATHVRTRYGRCDILVHSAAVVSTGGVDTVSEADWDRVFAVNVKGIWAVSRALLPLMGNGTAIVTVSSAAGLRAIPDMAAYVASKAAVLGLTRSMAIDLAERGIRVNCVCPGLVDTPMARRSQELRTDSARQAVEEYRGYLVRRHGEAREIAEAVVLLATNAYTTGAALAVDGGRSLH